RHIDRREPERRMRIVAVVLEGLSEPRQSAVVVALPVRIGPDRRQERNELTGVGGPGHRIIADAALEVVDPALDLLGGEVVAPPRLATQIDRRNPSRRGAARLRSGGGRRGRTGPGLAGRGSGLHGSRCLRTLLDAPDLGARDDDGPGALVDEHLVSVVLP